MSGALKLARQAAARFGTEAGWNGDYQRDILKGAHDDGGYVRSALFALEMAGTARQGSLFDDELRAGAKLRAVAS